MLTYWYWGSPIGSAVTAARDMFIGQALAPTFVFIGYGVVKFFTLGPAPLIGSIPISPWTAE